MDVPQFTRWRRQDFICDVIKLCDVFDDSARANYSPLMVEEIACSRLAASADVVIVKVFVRGLSFC